MCIRDSHRSPRGSWQEGSWGPEHRCLSASVMLGPQQPPRMAAWSAVRTASRLRPESWTRTAPKRRRMQVGICK
eukprot:11312336-Alexandrium_andersonii.AAC.1